MDPVACEISTFSKDPRYALEEVAFYSMEAEAHKKSFVILEGATKDDCVNSLGAVSLPTHFLPNLKAK